MEAEFPDFRGSVVIWPSVLALFAALLFAGALLCAKEQDPFTRQWFKVNAADGRSVKCVAVLPKPVRRWPVIVYAHGSGGTLMNDGNVLRQMAELGLAVVSLQYDQTNELAFAAQFEAVLGWVGRRSWAKTNAIAWVGFGLGANRMLDLVLRHPNVQPRLLVELGGGGMDQAAKLIVNLRARPKVGQASRLPGERGSASGGSQDVASAAPTGAGGTPALLCSVLLVHWEQDQIHPIGETKRLAAVLRRNGLSVERKR